VCRLVDGEPFTARLRLELRIRLAVLPIGAVLTLLAVVTLCAIRSVLALGTIPAVGEALLLTIAETLVALLPLTTLLETFTVPLVARLPLAALLETFTVPLMTLMTLWAIMAFKALGAVGAVGAVVSIPEPALLLVTRVAHLHATLRLLLALATPELRLALHLVGEARDGGLLALANVLATAVVVTHVVHVDRVHVRASRPVLLAAIHIAAALLQHLLAIGQDDPIVVLGMLEIILRQHRISGRLSVACQLDVLLSHVGRGATHLYVGTVRLEAARQRILMLTVVALVIVVVPAATAAVLLSLPHGLPFSLLLITRPDPAEAVAGGRLAAIDGRV